MTLKFLTKNTHEKYETTSKKVFEGNSKNKINLEDMRMTKIKFGAWTELIHCLFFLFFFI